MSAAHRTAAQKTFKEIRQRDHGGENNEARESRRRHP
jgi:hypothetical protein